MCLFLQYLVISLHLSSICGEYELLILHNSDMHFTLDETLVTSNRYGGLARVAQIVKEARAAQKEKNKPPVLYLNAGDFYNEPVWLNPFTKKIAIELLNVIKPDVASFGCHDLDFGIEYIRSFIKRIKFPMIASNLHFTNSSRLVKLFAPSTILTRGNRKIGIVGYVTPKNHLVLRKSPFYFEDEITAIRREGEILRERGASIIIALGHSGFEMDMRIAKKVEFVDIVIGGLTNTFLWNGKAPHDEEPHDSYPIVVVQETGRKVLLATTYGFTKYMGSLKVVYDDLNKLTNYEGNPIFLDNKIRQDPTILHLIRTYGASIRTIHKEEDVLASCIVGLDAKSIRDEESNIGNFIVDSFVEYMALKYTGPYWTDVPISLINSGAIRKSILTSKKTPNITKKIISQVLPFRQRLVLVTLLGSGILETLETGVRSNGETRGGEFLQVSGIRVRYDFKKPRGKRVVYAKTFCNRCEYPSFEHLDPNKHYNVIVNTFLVNGGDGHDVYKARSLSLQPMKVFGVDVVIDILKRHGIIRPEVEERITYANNYRRVKKK